MKAVVGRFFSKYGIVIASPILITLILALTLDLRFIIVAWMIPCVIYPMLMTLAYYSVMLHKDMRILSFRRTATYTKDRELVITPEPDDPDDDRPLPQPIIIPEQMIDDITAKSGRLRFVINPRCHCRLRYIDIPVDSIKSA